MEWLSQGSVMAFYLRSWAVLRRTFLLPLITSLSFRTSNCNLETGWICWRFQAQLTRVSLASRHPRDVNTALLSHPEQPYRSPHVCWFLLLKYLVPGRGRGSACAAGDLMHLWGKRDCAEIAGLTPPSSGGPGPWSVWSASPSVGEMRTCPLGANLLWTEVK